ncbi:MAG TPA: DNA-processing protein DprA [Vicinamibacterales bacterium]|nr:DNA-processing protein DprA [Vicinamibacterales bacterium]
MTPTILLMDLGSLYRRRVTRASLSRTGPARVGSRRNARTSREAQVLPSPRPGRTAADESVYAARPQIVTVREGDRGTGRRRESGTAVARVQSLRWSATVRTPPVEGLSMDALTAAALAQLEGVSRYTVRLALRAVADEPADESRPLAERLLGRLASETGRRPAQLTALFRAARREAAGVLERAARAGVEAIPWGDVRYPALLARIADPPPILWLRGSPEVLASPCVAVIGSRRPSPYALEVGERLAAELAARGVAVVSGLARGVDTVAHRGALAGGGRTIAVLGSGVDVVYPAENTGLAARIGEQGALVSELPPGTPPRAAHFPQRNRLISGLSLAVLVVEAGLRSGSLITARCALEQGREVMAVPGSVLSERNRGAHALLRDGAKLVECADDILSELGRPAGPNRGPSAGSAANSLTEDPLLATMEAGEEYDLDRLVALSGLAAHALLPRLAELELAGAVMRLPGGRFARARRKGC